MTGNEQSHKFKKLLNGFSVRVGHIICNSHVFACQTRSNKLGMQTTEMFWINENNTLILLPLTRKTVVPPALAGVNNHK